MEVDVYVRNSEFGAHEVAVIVPYNSLKQQTIAIVPNNKIIVNGRITDGAGKPLEGMEVSVSSTQIIEGIHNPIKKTNEARDN